MVSKIMLDVNIVLDFTLKRAQYEMAKRIMELVINTRIDAFVTPAMIHIAGYWLTKEYGASKAKKLLSTLLLDVQVIDINHETTLRALNSQMDDIEDALQYHAALYHKLDMVISRDKEFKKAAIPLLPVYTPEEFLDEYSFL